MGAGSRIPVSLELKLQFAASAGGRLAIRVVVEGRHRASVWRERLARRLHHPKWVRIPIRAACQQLERGLRRAPRDRLPAPPVGRGRAPVASRARWDPAMRAWPAEHGRAAGIIRTCSPSGRCATAPRSVETSTVGPARFAHSNRAVARRSPSTTAHDVSLGALPHGVGAGPLDPGNSARNSRLPLRARRALAGAGRCVISDP